MVWLASLEAVLGARAVHTYTDRNEAPTFLQSEMNQQRSGKGGCGALEGRWEEDRYAAGGTGEYHEVLTSKLKQSRIH